VRAVATVVLSAAVVAGCGSDELQTSPTCDEAAELPEGARLRSVLPDGEAPAPPSEAAVPQGEVDTAFRPEGAEAVYCEDFADPFVLSVDQAIGHQLFAFGTQNAAAQVPVLHSTSILGREEVSGALPLLPAWSAPGGVWAPAVLAVGGQHVLYYATTDAASGRQCISVATSDEPEGPFTDASSGPLVCPLELGGAIDPSPFTDRDGTTHLLWKNDGNCCDIPTRIFSQPLSPDGLQLAGPAQELLRSDQPWEGSVIEAPAMLEQDGTYLLFYSANAWNTAAYAIGYASCAGPRGPCDKPLDGPWLASSEAAAGPGGMEVFRDGDGDLRAIFHAWVGAVGYEAGGVRQLFTIGIDLVDGRPVTVA